MFLHLPISTFRNIPKPNKALLRVQEKYKKGLQIFTNLNKLMLFPHQSVYFSSRKRLIGGIVLLLLCTK